MRRTRLVDGAEVLATRDANAATSGLAHSPLCLGRLGEQGVLGSSWRSGWRILGAQASQTTASSLTAGEDTARKSLGNFATAIHVSTGA